MHFDLCNAFRLSGWTFTGLTTLATTGNVSVRSFGKAIVSAEEKRPLTFTGPSFTLIRKHSDEESGSIFHFNAGWLDGINRISSLFIGAFTQSLTFFSWTVFGAISPKSQISADSFAKRLTAETIVK
ncbi:MAG: hypothetical protein ACE5PV_10345 [Candidatus Poribacteria bacterium]